MQHYDFIFVVLCYKNTKDIILFLNSLKNVKGTYKVVIVDGFSSEEVKNTLSNIAEKNNCDFMSIPNKGYSYGNNQGIEFARRHYDFEFIVVSNPDIEIQNLNIDHIRKYNNKIIGPYIENLTGKHQNPYRTGAFLSLIMKMMYKSYKDGVDFPKWIVIAINKIFRELMNIRAFLFQSNYLKVFALHGSFILFGRSALEALGTAFDANMFLFNEEDYVAFWARQNHVTLYYCPKERVLHHEDGSMSLSNINHDMYKQSFLYVYDKFCKK